MSTWYPEYVKFIETMRREPFAWGKADCGPAWVGEFIKIVTGKNPLARYEGKYTTNAGALRTMRKAGFTDLKKLMIDALGSEPLHPSQGCLGDLALIADDSHFKYSYGIVNGERVFFRRPDGIGTIDLLEAECIFKL